MSDAATTAPADTIAVRDDERLDTGRLEPWLRARLEHADGPMTVRQFGGGRANLTYLVAFGDRSYVLRRPPFGRVAASAHDMKREHRVLSRLWERFPLAPRSLLLCTDPDVIGADFHVMERRRGRVIRDDNAASALATPDAARRTGEMLVDTLAALHAVDPAAVGLDDLGRPEGFLRRQVEGWVRRWQDARDPGAPEIDDVTDWLAARRPAHARTSLLHNDYKLDNVMVAAGDPGRATAVLDWDMCTRGDPLSDLGSLLNYWVEADDPPAWRSGSLMTAASIRSGFPTRAEALDRYRSATGFDLSEIGWHHAFGAFKLAVILQQIYIRFLRGQTRDERFAGLGERVRVVAEKARILTKSC